MVHVIHSCVALQDGPERRSVGKIATATVMHAQNGCLGVPRSDIQRLDKARVKQKEVYEGSFQASNSFLSMCTESLSGCMFTCLT